MKANMGTIDRAVRAILGLVVIVAGLVFQSWPGAIGLVMLATAGTGRCPLYIPFGISTRSEGPTARAGR